MHYFRDKEDLLLFAFRLVAERVGRRWPPRQRASRIPSARCRILRGLPLDAESRAEIRLWFSFLGLALTRPASPRPSAWPTAAGAVVWPSSCEAQRAGRLDLGSTPSARRRLVALVDGLAVQASFEPRAFTGQRHSLLDERLAIAAPLLSRIGRGCS